MFPRAFRFLLLGALAVLLAACGRPPAPNPPAPVPVATEWFTDITEAAGLRFLHDNGATGDYFMPESVGSGAALFDFDNDGLLDVLLLQCGGPTSTNGHRLFQQQPGGSFRDVSAGSGLDGTGRGMGCAVGDVDNDGLPDVLITEFGGARLFLNTGSGKFTDITVAAGLDNPRWGTAAAFFDYDRDGRLDCVIANYLDYPATMRCTDAAGRPEYCGPQGFPGVVTRLFRNLGPIPGARAPRFADVTVSSGLARAPGPALGLLCADFDGDRWPDIFLADDGRANRLFLNRRDGTFADDAAARGLAFNAMGNTAANMGSAVGDVDGNGLFDLFITHLNIEQHALWTQGPRGLFQDRTAALGLASPAQRGTGFGTALVDFDCDGDLDLTWVNGHVRRPAVPDAAPRVPGLRALMHPYAQRNQIFANDGAGRFTDVSAANPSLCARSSVHRSLAVGDVNNDGAPDLLLTSGGGPARLLKNTAPRGRWLQVRALLGPAHGHRDAHGAEIILTAGGRMQWRLAQPSQSYLASHDPRAHFGLGGAASYESLKILWPDGTEETFPGGSADRLVTVRQGGGEKR